MFKISTSDIFHQGDYCNRLEMPGKWGEGDVKILCRVLYLKYAEETNQFKILEALTGRS